MFDAVVEKIQSVLLEKNIHKNLGWMDTLAEMDGLSRLKETRAQLAKIEFLNTEQLTRQIEMVLRIDNNTQHSVRKITHKYLNALKTNKALEVDIYNAVYLYQRQLYSAYMQFFDFYQAQDIATLDKAKLQLIFARHLNAAFIMNKWRYFDDQPTTDGTWTGVHKIIKAVEKLAIINDNLFLYESLKKETSIATLLKRGFMMDTLHKGNYHQVQIQLTEKILDVWASNPVFANKFKEDRYHFYINLDNDKGPDRIRTLEQFGNYRFWKTSRLTSQIEAYLCAVDTQKPLEEFGLEQIAPASVVVKLFKKLRVDWCMEGYERQRRKKERVKNSKLLEVCYGLDQLYAHMSAMAQHQAKTDDAEPVSTSTVVKAALQRGASVSKVSYNVNAERWWMVDESETGFAVDLGKEVSEWVEAGKLVGCNAADDKEQFFIAEIRSVRKQANATHRAGLQLIADKAQPIQISRVEKAAPAEVVSGYFVDDEEATVTNFRTFGVLLIKSNAYSPNTTIIMPRTEYKRDSQYRVNVNGVQKVFKLGRLISKARDWVRVELAI